jgi:hypothetical protein
MRTGRTTTRYEAEPAGVQLLPAILVKGHQQLRRDCELDGGLALPRLESYPPKTDQPVDRRRQAVLKQAHIQLNHLVTGNHTVFLGVTDAWNPDADPTCDEIFKL